MLSELASYEIDKDKEELKRKPIQVRVDIDGTPVNIGIDPYLVELYGESYAIEYAVRHSSFVGAL